MHLKTGKGAIYNIMFLDYNPLQLHPGSKELCLKLKSASLTSIREIAPKHLPEVDVNPECNLCNLEMAVSL